MLEKDFAGAIGLNNIVCCLQSLLTDNALCDSLGFKSYKRGGENAGILHEVQKKG